jgi:hypothetical protein
MHLNLDFFLGNQKIVFGVFIMVKSFINIPYNIGKHVLSAYRCHLWNYYKNDWDFFIFQE